MTDRPLVAVLGGGQLGRMLALAGIPLGLRFRFFDPAPDACAGAVGELVTGTLDDDDAAQRAATGATAVTYEWEGVPAATAHAAGVVAPLAPPAGALDVAQDRLAEKELFARLGIPTARFAAVDDRASFERAVAEIGLPAVVKTRRGGYDGKGQAVLRDSASVESAWHALGGVPLIVEAFVAFDRELSVVAVRGRDGATATWPLGENEHRDGILRATRAPALDLDPAHHGRAEHLVHAVLDELSYVGVLCVELFEVGGELLANELAPRVHNSGHWTIEGAETSQFENHLRAVLGWPLGSTRARGVAAMVNCIGALPAPSAVAAIAGAHLHDYGKAPRPGRKVGHVTVTGADDTELSARFAAVRRVVDTVEAAEAVS